MKKKMSKLKKREMIAAYCFMLPAFLCLLVWTILPMITSFGYSVTDFNIISDFNIVGLENYKNLLKDKEWLLALRRTFKYVAVFVPLMYGISLGAAEMIKHLTKFSSFFRTSYYLPVVVSAAAAGAIFKLVLSTKLGPVNLLLSMAGFEKINFLGKPSNALYSCAVLAVWLGFGNNMIIFLAGLLDVPRVYYEAAAIDGASGPQQFRYITFPALGRTSIFVLTMSFINSFQTYDMIKQLTNGGPNNATTLVIQRIYINAFQHYKMGYACAMTVMLFVIIFIVTMLQLKITSKMADNGWE